MQSSRKSLLMLVSMLLLGAVLGAAGMTVLRPRPPGPPGPDGPSGGFVAHMERTIQPRDSAQRAAILPILEAADQRNRETVDESERIMREHLATMQAALAPILDPAQRERLDDLVRSLGRPPRERAGRDDPPRGGPPPR